MLLFLMVALFLADSMEKSVLLHVFVGVVALLGISLVTADDPYRYYTWTVTYGTLSPLGVPQQVGIVSNFGLLAKNVGFGFLKFWCLIFEGNPYQWPVSWS